MKVEKGEEKPGGKLVKLTVRSRKEKSKAGRKRVSKRRNGVKE